MLHRTDAIALVALVALRGPPAPLPSPSELSVAPDYAIHGPADNALHDMVHASATDDMCQRCDNDVACARGLRTSTYLLHELVGCDREPGCPAIESWVPLIQAPARDKSAMYKSLFSTASLLFELLNGPPVPSRPTAPCIFFLLFLLVLLTSPSPPFPPSTTRAQAVHTQLSCQP